MLHNIMLDIQNLDAIEMVEDIFITFMNLHAKYDLIPLILFLSIIYLIILYTI